MRLRSHVLFALSLAACQAYDHSLYARLVDGSGIDAVDSAADTLPHIDARLDAGMDVAMDTNIDANLGDSTNPCAACPSNEICCGGRCVDLSTSRFHCGSCAMMCPGTQCSGGTCTSTCATGFGNCDQNIVINGCEANLAIDPANCGACQHPCDSGVCNDGFCAVP